MATYDEVILSLRDDGILPTGATDQGVGVYVKTFVRCRYCHRRVTDEPTAMLWVGGGHDDDQYVCANRAECRQRKQASDAERDAKHESADEARRKKIETCVTL